MTEVDVIILSWNDGELVPTAVRSALAAADGLDVSVTVVDNGSETAPDLPDDERVHLVQNAYNRGVAGGRNDGMAHTTRPIVCFLDSDAVLHEESLRMLVSELESDPTIAMAVPVFTDQAPQASAGRAPGLRRKLIRIRDDAALYEPFGDPDGDEQTWEVEFGIGACQVFRRSVFNDVGSLDESLYWTEDVDFCLRVRDQGHRIVQVGRTRVDHPPRRRSRRPLSSRGLRHGWAVLRYAIRHRRW